MQLNREKTPFFNQLTNDFLYRIDKLFSFIQVDPYQIANFTKQIELKKTYSEENRNILFSELKSNYKNFNNSSLTKTNIELIQKNTTFTVTTGHQLCLLTGPLYSIYKILHTIKLAEVLNEKLSNNQFVPIFWMANEDHDAEEINHIHLFNNKISWEYNQEGAVGDFDLRNIDAFENHVKSLFKEGELDNLFSLFKGENLNELSFSILHHLFDHLGLLILNPNKKSFKKLFIPLLEKEINEQFSYHEVLKTNEELSKLNYPTQVTPREVNLFYLSKGKRTRIKFEDNLFLIEEEKYTREEIISLIRKNPESFSPNVILRPLYQEIILPNLCYIGGAGEIAYWLQLKSVFSSFNLVYPLLQIRNSIHILDQNTIGKLEKLKINPLSFFNDLNQLKNEIKYNFIQDPFDENNINNSWNHFKNDLIKESEKIDSTSQTGVLAEISKIEKQIQSAYQKLKKIEKNKLDVQFTQIENVYQKNFPNNNLQERHYNFLHFVKNGDYSDFISTIYKVIDPFNKDLIIINI